MDFGAEWNNYAADCSRTLPVSGRFSPRQRELYDATLRVFHHARSLMQTGILMNDFQLQVGRMWEEEHVALGLYSLEDIRRNTGSSPLWKNYFMHGISHSMGLDVHDPFDREQPFREGMVLSCEPAIYIPEEGLGIRLENDILITDAGPVDLMEDIPLEAEAIEALMQTQARS
jgi:Xaa-Pro aminopeptidase